MAGEAEVLRALDEAKAVMAAPAAVLETMHSDTKRWADLIKATGIAIPQ